MSSSLAVLAALPFITLLDPASWRKSLHSLYVGVKIVNRLTIQGAPAPGGQPTSQMIELGQSFVNSASKDFSPPISRWRGFVGQASRLPALPRRSAKHGAGWVGTQNS